MSETRQVRTTANGLVIRSLPVIGTGTDTGFRLLPAQAATSHGSSWDGAFQFISGPAGNGWAASAYLVNAAVPEHKLYTLEGEDPELTTAIEKLRVSGHALGIQFDTADFGGVRTKADTVRILKYRDDDYAVYVRNLKKNSPAATPVAIERWRPINPFGTSYHNYGGARDLKIIASHMPKADALAKLGSIAHFSGLRWGGFFGRVDPPHFELPITLAEVKRRYEVRLP